MRKIKIVIYHCSASDKKEHDNVETIRRWHVDGNGWSDVGYQYIITQDGVAHKCRPIWKVGAHCKGKNKYSIGICLTGLKNFTEAQFETARKLSKAIKLKYKLKNKDFYPHNYFNKYKTCPVYEISSVL